MKSFSFLNKPLYCNSYKRCHLAQKAFNISSLYKFIIILAMLHSLWDLSTAPSSEGAEF